MQLDEARQVDVNVTAADVRRAEREATEAEELAAELERQAVEDGTATAAQVVEARELGRFAKARIELTRKRAERAAAARRLLALEQVGADIDNLAEADAGAVGTIAAAVRRYAEAGAALLELTSAHDRAVDDLIKRARDLNAGEPGGGISVAGSASAHVTLDLGSPWRRRGIRHHDVKVRAVGSEVTEAMQVALAGDVDSAVKLLTT